MKKPVSLSIVDSIRVDSPCHESWEAMEGDARERFCASCRHSVNNISEMTREEAAVLLAGAGPGKRVCVRFRRRADGEIIFRKAPTAPGIGMILKRAAMIGLGVLAFLRFQSPVQAENSEQGDVYVPPHERMIMGEMTAPQLQQTPAPTVSPEPTLPCHTMGLVAPPKIEQPAEQREVEVMGKIAAPNP